MVAAGDTDRRGTDDQVELSGHLLAIFVVPIELGYHLMEQGSAR